MEKKMRTLKEPKEKGVIDPAALKKAVKKIRDAKGYFVKNDMTK